MSADSSWAFFSVCHDSGCCGVQLSLLSFAQTNEFQLLSSTIEIIGILLLYFLFFFLVQHWKLWGLWEILYVYLCILIGVSATSLALWRMRWTVLEESIITHRPLQPAAPETGPMIWKEVRIMLQYKSKKTLKSLTSYSLSNPMASCRWIGFTVIDYARNCVSESTEHSLFCVHQ